MKRRTFIAGVGSAAAWPIVARAQQPDRMRRIGILQSFDETDAEGKARRSWFMQGLAELGWTDGRNLRIDVRLAGSNVDRMRMFAKELVGLQPESLQPPRRRPLQSSGRRGRHPLYLQASPTPSARASLPACPARVATPPGSST